MKKSGNVITYYWKEDRAPDRFIDMVSRFLGKCGAIEFHDGWTIEQDMPDGSTRICGAFYTITGAKWLVDLLSKLSDIHLGKSSEVKIEVENDGTIKCKDDKP